MDPSCPTAPPSGDPPRTVALTVLLAEGVDPAQVLRHTRTAAAFWARHDLALVSGRPTARVPADPVLRGDGPTLERELADRTDAQARRRVAEDVLAPAVAFLDAHARPARDEIQLVFLPELASPSSPIGMAFADIAGLTLSRPLLDRTRADDPTLGLLRDVGGLEAPFTPTVFLSVSELARAESPFVVAHEIGHALGLPHVDDPSNLMAPRTPRCWPELGGDQVAVVVTPGPQAR